MKISSRFTVAVHILSLVHIERNQTLTSAYIAGSVNTNSVVIRRLISKLKQAGFLETHQG
ncbi:Rrf2 family transcriptional regulator, partial [Staphylococcus epidermidis]